MHDLEYHSAHAQMARSQRFRKSEISLDTGIYSIMVPDEKHQMSSDRNLFQHDMGDYDAAPAVCSG